MARPKKQTVDYYPHDCAHPGKTLKALEMKYQARGYAFWFKLLEKLGRTPGHYFEFNDLEIEFFSMETWVSQEETIDILNLLARFGAIDTDLWISRKGIWCQNFVDRIMDAYSARIDKPSKPVFSQETIVSEKKTPVSSQKTINAEGFPVSEIHKLNETKLNEININTPNKNSGPKYIPKDFKIEERTRELLKDFESLELYIPWFVDWATSAGKKKRDWQATFRNCVRSDWPGIRKNNSNKQNIAKTKVDKTNEYIEDMKRGFVCNGE